MHATTIVGYTFNADNYCPDCTFDGWNGNRPADMPGYASVEQLLTAIAKSRGIDRDDESSFDSGDFPKVIFADQVHDGCSLDNGYEPGQCGDRCGSCHEPLGFECPNVADKPQV